MPDAASSLDPKLVAEMLRQRGMLASGGNLRMVPFDPAAANSAAVDPNNPANSQSATAGTLAANAGGVPVQDATGKTVVIPTNATDIPANIPDNNLINLLPALAGAGGAALALLIRSKLAAKGINVPSAPDAIPTVEGIIEPDTAVNANSDIVDGEFTEVNDPRLGMGKGVNATNTPSDPAATAIEMQKRLPAPEPALTDTNASGKPKYLSADALRSRKAAARKAGDIPVEGSGPTITGLDSYADLSPEEMKQAKTIADSLIERRTAGRYRRYVQRKPGVGRDKLPTLPLDKESAFNLVVKAIRDARLNPNAVRKAIAR